MPTASSVQQQLYKVDGECASGARGHRSKLYGVRPEPDSNFIDQLYAQDREITVWFNRLIGKWQLFRRGHCVMTVQNDDRSYRPLDSRVITKLREADFMTRGKKKVLDGMLKHNDDLADRHDSAFRSHVKDTSEEVRKQFVKEHEHEIGARNIPKEDVQVPDTDTLEKQRALRVARQKPNYRRRDVGYLKRPE